MRRHWLLGLALLLLIAGLTGPMVIALGADRGEASFGDNETLGLNQLASASVVIDVGTNTVLLDTTAMAPGDRVGGQIVLENNGTLPLRYSLVADIGDGAAELLDVLEWKIWPTPASIPCGPAVGPFVFSGLMDEPAVLGNPAVGPDTGDRVVAPSTREVLCLEVALPIQVSDGLQGAAAQVDLTVIAEQATEETP